MFPLSVMERFRSWGKIGSKAGWVFTSAVRCLQGEEGRRNGLTSEMPHASVAAVWEVPRWTVLEKRGTQGNQGNNALVFLESSLAHVHKTPGWFHILGAFSWRSAESLLWSPGLDSLLWSSCVYWKVHGCVCSMSLGCLLCYFGDHHAGKLWQFIGWWLVVLLLPDTTHQAELRPL